MHRWKRLHIALDGLTCNRFEMAEFTKQCIDLNVNFIGICCGRPHHVREMAVQWVESPFHISTILI